jgi:hypothetical protein
MVCFSDNKRNEGIYMARKPITREVLLCAILYVITGLALTVGRCTWSVFAWRTSVNGRSNRS